MLIRKLRRRRLTQIVNGVLKRPNHAWYMDKVAVGGKIASDIGFSDIVVTSGSVLLTADKFGNASKASVPALRANLSQSIYSGTSDMSVFFRIKTADVNAFQMILCRGDANVVTQMSIGISYIGGKHQIQVGKGAADGIHAKVSTKELTVGVYSDVMISIKNNVVTFIIDGVEEVTSGTLPNIDMNTSPWYFCSDGRSAGNLFNVGTFSNSGALQDLAIWNTEALTLTDYNLLLTAPMSTLYSGNGDSFNYGRSTSYPSYVRGSGNLANKFTSHSDYEFRSIGYVAVPLNNIQKTGIRVLEFNRAINISDGYFAFMLYPLINASDSNDVTLRDLARQHMGIWLALIIDYSTGNCKVINTAGTIIAASNVSVSDLQSHEFYVYTNSCFVQMNRGHMAEKISSSFKPAGWGWL